MNVSSHLSKSKLYQDASLFVDPVEYLGDVFRRIKTTVKDKLVDLLKHRWQPATVGVPFSQSKGC